MKTVKRRRRRVITSLKQYPRVEVTWRDAASGSKWKEPAECCAEPHDGLLECQTVGYLLKKGREAVIVAQTRGEHGKVSNDWAIPRRSVVKIVRR